jgi:hypothetical protein
MTGLTTAGVAGRLRDFLMNNPDEELSYDDIVAKFSCSKKNAAMAVMRLTRMGTPIESVHVIRHKSMGMPRNAEQQRAASLTTLRFVIWLECAEAPRLVDDFMPRYPVADVFDSMAQLQQEGLIEARQGIGGVRFAAIVPASKTAPAAEGATS